MNRHNSTKILVVGASGQIGRRLIPKLISKGYSVVAAVRNAAKAAEFEQAGAEVRVADLEGELGSLCEGIDIVIFTAGSGSATGKDKTLTVDLWGAVKCIRAAKDQHVSHFIMISALKAKAPEDAAEALRPYLVAKASADQILTDSGLNYSILRPGRLIDEATGTYETGANLLDFNGSTSRAHVADCICELIATEDQPKVLDILSQRSV